jgi:hypothetical protein
MDDECVGRCPFKPLVLGSNPSALTLMNFPRRGKLSPTQTHFEWDFCLSLPLLAFFGIYQ